MTDGLRLRESWTSALNEAQAQLRSFLVSSSSSIWRRVPPPAKDPAASPPSPKGKGRAPPLPDEADVNIHKRSSKSGDIFRLVLDIPADDDIPSLESWKAVLATPETRKEWDPAVENAHHIETFDSNTRITKTYYTLGWPANPRDSITISRTFTDPTTLIDVSTSLPRSPDEPGYLRSTPPYVRSHVHLVAWCIQILSGPAPDAKKIRITCFWQHDLKAVWGIGTASRPQHLTALLIGLVKVVRKRGNRVPLLHGFGLGVSIDNLTFDRNREALATEYSIHHDSEDDDLQRKARKNMEELHAMKERRRLERAIECTLPSSVGWDVQLTTRGSSSEVTALPWTVEVVRMTSEADREYLLLCARHAALPSKHALLKVTLSIEVAGGTKGLRLNGSPHPIGQTESRDPSSFRVPQPLLQDATSVTGLSFQTASTAENSQSDTASNRMSLRLTGLQAQNRDKSILGLVRRNYVYFASLLQEPEAKWKPLAEARGVTVNQLDSIDPTLVVYRAEAVFVGVGLWDLLSVVSTPGAALYWDKTFDDAILLEDVNELTDLWHLKTKAAWPVQARESVLLRISYKSPNSVHLFSFSTDDANLFPQIPPSDPNVIRTQVDLRGWAIEALSPNTTQITLIEQSDPKGWSNKSSIPQQMIATLAGVGEFCIKTGGPPIVSRLGGGRTHVTRYDHEKGVFRLEYEGDISRRANSTNSIAATPSSSQTDLSDTTIQTPVTSTAPSRPFIECELRCDLDTWATSLEVLIDPPAQSVSCLRRHRLAEGGGGLWLTIEHDADFVVDEQLKVMVRRGTGAKGTVLVNGAKVKVEVQELPEADVKSLVKRKRVRPSRIPLDQPPVLSVIKRRKAEWADEVDEVGRASESGGLKDPAIVASSGAPSSVRVFGTSPFTKFLTTAISQATNSTSAAAAAVAAVGKPAFVQMTEQSVPSSSKVPIQHALDALAYLRMYHNRASKDGWTLVNETGGFAVHKKLETEVSTSIPVHRGEKVIEGFAAEDVASVLASYECRRVWDDKFDSTVILEDYGAGCHSAFTILKGGFPFRDRGFYTASVIARVADDTTSKRDSRVTGGTLTVIYCATASYHPDSVSGFSAAKYNPYSLPIGRVHLQGWILETLDPYTAENYTIPSTRCTHLVAVDFAGAVPVAYNAVLNAALPRAILGVESYIKANALVPSLRMPTPVIAVEREEGPQEGWTYERRDLERQLVGTRYAVQSQRFRATVLVEFPSVEAPPPEDRTPTPSRLLPGSLIRPSNSPERSATLDPSNSGQRYTQPTVRSTGIEGGTTPRLTHTQGGRTMSLRAPLRANSTSPRRPTTSLSGNEHQLERDFLIAEIIVSLELYPSGFEIQTTSVLRSNEEPTIPLVVIPRADTPVLPIITTVFTLPPSPLRPSDKTGTRYLVRLTFPTARYEVPTIEDPLTGEMRAAPPNPQWLKDLRERGAVVDVLIKPLVVGENFKDATNRKKENFGQDATKPDVSKTEPMKVLVEGALVEVVGEKRAVVMLGKALDDERISKMPWLARSDAVLFPRALADPMGVATPFLNDPPPKEEPPPDHSTSPETANIVAEASDEVPVNSKDAPVREQAKQATKFMGLFSAYSSSVTWITGSLGKKTNTSRAKDSTSNATPAGVPGSSANEGLPKDGGISALPQLTSNALCVAQRVTIPLSSAIVIALISFLIGSLLRSLLSPADFVYVARDAQDMHDFGDEHGGWRELRRLMELRYIFGGWDLVVAVVRRH